MVSEALQSRYLMAAMAEDLLNLPTGEEAVGTVYAPQTRKPIEGFAYFRGKQSKFNFPANVTREHAGDLADAVSKKVGKRYSVATFQVLYDNVFKDPETIEDPVLKEISKYCWAHVREARVGNKIYSDPHVRYVDGKFRISGKSVEVKVDETDAVRALESAKLFKEDPKRKVSRGRILTNPASFRASWCSVGGAFFAYADAPDYRRDFSVALLVRTDEH